MIPVILWFLIITLVGWITFPLSFTLFPALPERGYAFSRALGLLLWGFIFWFLTSIGLLTNNQGSVILSLCLLVIVNVGLAKRISINIFSEWWRQHHLGVITIEVLFVSAFIGWTVVRSLNPEIVGTEKPMELAFINAILKSPTFPPHDPWLSGYAISYYYFGYVLIAMLAQLTSVLGSVAFNLGIALIFGLSAIVSYGLIYNLLYLRKIKRHPNTTLATDKIQQCELNISEKRNLITNAKYNFLKALLGPFFVLILCNIEGFLHVLHNRGVFWRLNSEGVLISSFWRWVDLRELSLPPSQPFSWFPQEHWWWWRASRIIQDYDLAGNWKEIIDEFPFFSFLLGDLHPHVLAIPFALVLISIALNQLVEVHGERITLFNRSLHIKPYTFVLVATVLGGLGFLNTWDFPIYIVIFCGAYLLGRLRASDQEQDSTVSDIVLQDRKSKNIIVETVLLGLALLVAGIILYFPFYLGFSSQAGGILPNISYSTRGVHLWIMFVVLLLPIFALLIRFWYRSGNVIRFVKGFGYVFGVFIFIWVISALMAIGISRLPVLGDLYQSTIGIQLQLPEILVLIIKRRLVSSGGWITLLLLLSLVIGLVIIERKQNNNSQDSYNKKMIVGEEEGSSVDILFRKERALLRLVVSDIFTWLLILVGAVLVFIPEFFYLRDQFGWRMNTIFKFYYQAWLIWGIVAAYGILVLWDTYRSRIFIIFRIAVLVVIAMGMVYPVLSLWSKTNGFRPQDGFSLDGTAFLERQSPEEMVAIQWLSSKKLGVLAEAVGPRGGSYTGYGRVSMMTGFPAVLGWAGHESQWRGGGEEIGTRESDIERLYQSNNWGEIQEIINQYKIRYIFVGILERSRYRVNEGLFKQFLHQIYEQDLVAIYSVP